MTETEKPKRARLSVDLEAYQDVFKMLQRAELARRGVKRTFFVIEALRRDLTNQGFARKGDTKSKSA